MLRKMTVACTVVEFVTLAFFLVTLTFLVNFESVVLFGCYLNQYLYAFVHAFQGFFKADEEKLFVSSLDI